MVEYVQLLDVEGVERWLQVFREDIAGIELGRDSPNPTSPIHVVLSDGMMFDVNGAGDV